MTIWAAEQYGEQDTKGSLEAGNLATCNPMEPLSGPVEDQVESSKRTRAKE